jgi:hypothetical protein
VAAGWAASEQEYNFVPTGTETDVSIRLGLAGALSRFFWITRVSGLSKYATDDRGQKDQRNGQEQSGNNLSSQRDAASSSRSARLTARIEFGGPQFLLQGVDDGKEQPIAPAATAGIAPRACPPIAMPR